MSQPWERVDTGRYATEYNGHTLQAMRRDGPYDRSEKPYVAVVDRVPVADAWSLALAKTAAIRYVERQSTKAKAERAFTNGHKVTVERIAGPPDLPEPQPEPQPEPHDVLFTPVPDEGVFHVSVVEAKPKPEPEPEPDSALEVTMSALSELSAQQLGQPGQIAITGRLIDGPSLLDTLNALQSALDLLREHADLECHINLPPMMKL